MNFATWAQLTWFNRTTTRWAFFFLLVAWGLAYIGWFAYLMHYSRDFIAAQRIEAVCTRAHSGSISARSFPFSEAEADKNMLASGWGQPEPWGVWSAEQKALLVLPTPFKVDADGARLDLELLVPTNQKIPVLPVRVLLSGRQIARWLLRDETNVDIQHLEFSAETLRGRNCIELGFLFERAYRPIKEHLGKDARLFGVGLIRATWVILPAPQPGADRMP